MKDYRQKDKWKITMFTILATVSGFVLWYQLPEGVRPGSISEGAGLFGGMFWWFMVFFGVIAAFLWMSATNPNGDMEVKNWKSGDFNLTLDFRTLDMLTAIFAAMVMATNVNEGRYKDLHFVFSGLLYFTVAYRFFFFYDEKERDWRKVITKALMLVASILFVLGLVRYNGAKVVHLYWAEMAFIIIATVVNAMTIWSPKFKLK